MIDFAIEPDSGLRFIHPLNRKATRWLFETAPVGAEFFGNARVIKRREFATVFQLMTKSGFAYVVGGADACEPEPELRAQIAAGPWPPMRHHKTDRPCVHGMGALCLTCPPGSPDLT